MTAADETKSYAGLGEPVHQYVILDIAQSETFVSKLGEVWGVLIQRVEDSSYYINATVSGSTITFYSSGAATNVQVFCDIVGRL